VKRAPSLRSDRLATLALRLQNRADMRRHLPGLLLLLAPAAALATPITSPASGQLVFDQDSDTAYINSLQCQGTASDAFHTVNLDVNVTWQLAVASDTTWATGGKYYLFVTNRVADSGTTSCTQTTTATEISSQAVLTQSNDTTGLLDVPVDTQLMTTKISVSKQAIANAYLKNLPTSDAATCTANPAQASDQDVFLCLEWVPVGGSTTTPKGRALGNAMIFDVVGPTDAPALSSSISPGDGRLYPNWTGISSEASATYVAYAVDPTGAHPSRQSDMTSSLSGTITGLTNNVPYDVTVRAFDAAGNVGVPSTAVSGTPLPVDDFWNTYQKAGGQETGGCGTGAAGVLGLLGAAAGLAVARRRKP
jgi:hypothetical protein